MRALACEREAQRRAEEGYRNPHGSLPWPRKLPSAIPTCSEPKENPFRQATNLGLVPIWLSDQAFANFRVLPGLIPASNRAAGLPACLAFLEIFNRISSTFACLQTFNPPISGPVHARWSQDRRPSQPVHSIVATLAHDETWVDKSDDHAPLFLFRDPFRWPEARSCPLLPRRPRAGPFSPAPSTMKTLPSFVAPLALSPALPITRSSVGELTTSALPMAHTISQHRSARQCPVCSSSPLSWDKLVPATAGNGQRQPGHWHTVA